MQLTTKEIEEKLSEITSETDPFLEECKGDSRKGVQKLVHKWLRNYAYEKSLQEQFYKMMTFERTANRNGFRTVAGIDEAGRGPLAGPVVAAAVILREDCYIPGLTDSKKLSQALRDKFYKEIKNHAIAIGIGIISAEEIDQINIYEATKKAMMLAINELKVKPDYLLLDAMKLEMPIAQESIVKGDAKSISIAAGSVIAKVTRDRIMSNIARQYPEYGFDQHMGYGTRQHLEALKKHGVTEYHRKSFTPVKDMY